MIEGQELAVFVAIANERSFSRAADCLGIAQSVVSKRLRRLEDQLATQLVDRSVRNDVRLTRVGRMFLPEATETLAQLQRSERLARNLGRGTSGPLRIGFVFSAAMNGVLTMILRALRSDFPDLQFEPLLMETPEQLTALEDGRLDLGLLRPRPSYPAACRARVIHSERLMVCLASDHPLADRAELAPHQLGGQCFIVPQFHERVGLIDSIRSLARAGGFDMPPVIRTADFVTAACIAAAGDGIVLTPASLANLNPGGICFRNVTGFPEHLDTMLVHRADAPEAAIAAALALFV